MAEAQICRIRNPQHERFAGHCSSNSHFGEQQLVAAVLMGRLLAGLVEHFWHLHLAVL
jgi:hypothetical protein